MASRSFTNAQLCTAWATAAALVPVGTRRNVVLALLAATEQADSAENYRKMYNNVTQRVKQLSEGTPAVSFPALAEGKKGARRSVSEVASLQALFAPPAPVAPPEVIPAVENTAAAVVGEALEVVMELATALEAAPDTEKSAF